MHWPDWCDGPGGRQFNASNRMSLPTPFVGVSAAHLGRAAFLQGEFPGATSPNGPIAQATAVFGGSSRIGRVRNDVPAWHVDGSNRLTQSRLSRAEGSSRPASRSAAPPFTGAISPNGRERRTPKTGSCSPIRTARSGRLSPDRSRNDDRNVNAGPLGCLAEQFQQPVSESGLAERDGKISRRPSSGHARAGRMITGDSDEDDAGPSNEPDRRLKRRPLRISQSRIGMSPRRSQCGCRYRLAVTVQAYLGGIWHS